MLKVKRVIISNIFKHIHLCKGEGVKAASNIFQQKNKKLIESDKSHNKVDLSKSIGYQYNIMKLSGYDEENMSFMDRTLWWETYKNHAIEKIR